MNSQVQIAELLQRIQGEVEGRRAAGLYPPGLEQQLEREFAEIISSTNRRYFASIDLQRAVKRLEDTFSQLSGQTSTESKIIGGSLIHRLLGKLTKRQVLGLTAQIRDVETNVILVLKMFGEFAESQEVADRRLVSGLSQHVLDRVAVVDHLAILTTELMERIQNLESKQGR
jgi:hypothetical protein